MPSKLQVVIAHHDEHLAWAYPVKDKCIVYAKGRPPKGFPNVVRLRNRGRDSDTYLRHIIMNYDDLADVTVFSQGRIIDHVYNPKIFIEIIENLPRDCGFTAFNLKHGQTGREGWVTVNDFESDIHPGISVEKWWKALYDEPEDHAHVFESNCCGVFAVSRERILFHPKSFYEKLLNMLNDDLEGPPVSDRGPRLLRRLEGVYVIPLLWATIMDGTTQGR